MEKPRPSPNFGNSTSTRVACARRAANAAGSSAGPSRRMSASGCGELSATTLRPLIRVGIDLFLERLDADAAHDVDEALFLAVAALEIARDQLLDHLRHLVARHRAADPGTGSGL